MRENLRAGILFLTILCIWGIIYPQYALTEDMYQVTGAGRTADIRDCATDYRQILTAGQGEVEIGFALWEQLEQWIGENKDDEDRGED